MAFKFIVLMVAMLASSAYATVLGSYSDEHLVTSETPLNDDPRLAFEEAVKLLGDELDGQSTQVVSYREQVVAGMHYLYKVKLGDGDHYMHLLVWRKPDGQVAISNYNLNKVAADVLEPVQFRAPLSGDFNILY